jgi:xanthine dehydrogenase accessory factor
MSTNEFVRIAEELAQGRAADLIRQAEGEIYVRRFVPEERLILLGGGHIARPLCAMGAMLDFAVTVVDDRPEYANRQRFPDAAQVICDEFVHAIKGLEIRSSDYVCVITRGHRWDRECLRAILRGQHPTYLGLISSRSRASALKELLVSEGYDADAVDAIHAPIGLKIGAITPAEIAVSICAQLVEHRRSLPTRAKVPGLLAQTNTDPAFLRFMVEDCPKALLLVLSANGSTPVKSGAVMAVDANGRGYGTIGGGEGEAEAMELARDLIGTGQARVLTVDMDGDPAGEDDLVCGGSLRLLIEDVQ